MAGINRREALGSLGTLAVAGGWIGLTAQEGAAQAAGAASTEPKEYVLPPLGYEFDALEPHIDAQTMQIHHDKHHAAYVKGLNTALKQLETVRQENNPDAYAKVRELTEAVAFNGAGHALHTVFWNNLKKGVGEPKGVIGSAIGSHFGSFAKFQAHFNQAAKSIQGGGWSVLGFEPLAGRLLVFGVEKHQNSAIWGAIPLLVLDVWEHAYYLKYQNDRAKYVEAFWNVVNWDNVAERLTLAQRLVG